MRNLGSAGYLSTQETEAGGLLEYTASLSYKISFNPVWNTKNFVSQEQTKQTKVPLLPKQRTRTKSMVGGLPKIIKTILNKEHTYYIKLSSTVTICYH